LVIIEREGINKKGIGILFENCHIDIRREVIPFGE
jgi:hypothetical protein